MEPIKILVGKNMEGYTFALLPSTREAIRKKIPGAFPANRIFVAYDVKDAFENAYDKIEHYILLALIGVSGDQEAKKLGNIEFIESVSGKVIHSFVA